MQSIGKATPQAMRGRYGVVIYFLNLNICSKFGGHSASSFSRGSLAKMPSVKYASDAMLGHIIISRRVDIPDPFYRTIPCIGNTAENYRPNNLA